MGETGKTQWGAEKDSAGNIVGEETMKSSCSSLNSSPRVEGIGGKVERPLPGLPPGSFSLLLS